MIPQTYPLYTSRLDRDFLVVGWWPDAQGKLIWPVLVPLDVSAGVAQVHRGQHLTFRTERWRPAPTPADAVTEKIPVPWRDAGGVY